jgi:hypothetical protein
MKSTPLIAFSANTERLGGLKLKLLLFTPDLDKSHQLESHGKCNSQSCSSRPSLNTMVIA